MLKRIKIKKSEIASIIFVALVLGLVVTLAETTQKLLYGILTFLIIITINSMGKKIAAYYKDAQIEIGIWNIKRYWFRAHDKFHKTFPMGIIFPFITTAFTFGLVNWMACLTFDIKKHVFKVAKRHDKYGLSEVTEWQTGVIAVWGLVANLISAIIAIKLGYIEFAKLSVYYTCYNIIPFSDIDGTKIYFAHKLLWVVSAIIILAATIIAAMA